MIELTINHTAMLEVYFMVISNKESHLAYFAKLYNITHA